MEPEQAMLDRYKMWWDVALRELLDWCPADRTAWIREMEQFLKEEIGLHWVWQLPPAKLLVKELITPALSTKVGDGLARLHHRLIDAIEDKRGTEPFCDPDIDWRACRLRVNLVLREYGGSLPCQGSNG